ncbi:MAG TPA: enoyl-CoA hydratase/isomerase family protein [Burkholderiales bacterium]|nr:enoyl-CoA hydratase/isomerase family protein [Burkholderiales bacterium]
MNAAPNIEYQCENKIALISMNRPQKLNAIDDDMVRSLMATMHQFDMDDEAHTAILCGNGRAFCSGADVRARQLRSAEELRQKGGPSAGDAKSGDIFMRSVNWKPVIAAVHGYVLGLGIGLALDCELVVAEEGTKFQITETPRGLSGSGKYMNLLAYRGSGGFATEVTLTGRFFTAEEALAAGVIDRVAPKGKYIEVARELAETINGNPPLAVRASVMQRRWQVDDDRREAVRYQGLNKLYLTEDFAEATRAFVEKRPTKPFRAR